MPRAATGPRRIDSSGYWYAVKMIKGKRHHISLKTKIRSEALRRWPEAQAELERIADPTKYKWFEPITYTELDPDTGKERVATTRAINLFNEEEVDLEVEEVVGGINWDKAIEIAAKRHQRKRGGEVSKSWKENVEAGLRALPARAVKAGPLSVKTADVREMVERMEAQGLSPLTIACRASGLSNLISSLIKGGFTDDEFTNPFDRVDTSAASTRHLYKAKPEDYQYMWAQRGNLAPRQRAILQLLIFSGVRIGEALNCTIETNKLIIRPTLDWKPKNKASIREVPIPEELAERTKGILVKSKGVVEVHAQTFRRHFNKLRPHDELTPHSFRHGYRTAARLAGAEEFTVERILGHFAGSQMSMTYGQYPEELLRREAEKVWKVLDSWAQRGV
ncbi:MULTISPECIES: tyrosine-type recombinase/integrase [unclassified Prochlorococcus]|uniref:tyrosine-type recombinase/integrase n=2 Tax=Prochlorococcus TaxID=1218 RepID=UPI0005339AB5|nr:MULTISPECIES: tyrosine-type recombinase/integrase [unclassified Prochlorococcus]KGG25560.1 Phage integrase family domain protein [Prochlorococcus sp. MIT 0701]KGG30685.1 Phage integrase family domain protein [Prochlorococcus sp. MIT 0702]KGG34869.1 Phage integrase family domain protein [Prochlorococcus sp. MIT 0703]